ncbi:hypothetical protein [Oscillibacter ruminantium]|nr:hypothetical protein [Oscillibacter ruminantium]
MDQKPSVWKQARELVSKDPVLRVLFWGGLACAAVAWMIVLSI